MSASNAAVRTFGSARQFKPSYRPGTDCPVCDGCHWHVGRLTAECARCATALPLARGVAA